MRYRWISLLFVVSGLGIFLRTASGVDMAGMREAIFGVSAVLPMIVVLGALWHVFRTLAWSQSPELGSVVSFGKLFRIRLIGEAVGFLTVRGVCGDPLKIWLLSGMVRARDATASIIRERIAYFVVTIGAMAGGAAIVSWTLTLPAVWETLYHAMASAMLPLVLVILGLLGRPNWLIDVMARLDCRLVRFPRSHTLWRACMDFVQQIVAPACWRRSIIKLGLSETVCFGCGLAETWMVIWASGAGNSVTRALAIEICTRMSNLVFAFVPGNVGTLEASAVMVAAGLGLPASTGATLALMQRFRALLWTGIGLMLYPSWAKDFDRNHATVESS